MKRNFVLTLVMLLAAAQAYAGGYSFKNISATQTAKVNSAAIAQIQDPFQTLVDWANKPYDDYAYRIQFMAVSMDRAEVLSHITGELVSTGKPYIKTKRRATQLYSNRTYKTQVGSHFFINPFDPKRPDHVDVQLEANNKRVRIRNGNKVLFIPLKFQNGVFYGVSPSRRDNHASYIFTFLKRKQHIVQ